MPHGWSCQEVQAGLFCYRVRIVTDVGGLCGSRLESWTSVIVDYQLEELGLSSVSTSVVTPWCVVNLQQLSSGWLFRIQPTEKEVGMQLQMLWHQSG